MATPPPSPPSPPQGDGTPDAGNPAGVAPPDVAPKPGRTSARRASSEKSPAAPRRRATPATPKASTRKPRKTATASNAPASNDVIEAASAKPKRPAPSTAKPRAAARPRVRPAVSASPTAPTRTRAGGTADKDVKTTPRRWWTTLAGGIGALAAGAAILSLRGSSRRRKAHQADGSDSSKSFEAGIADEGTIPDVPGQSVTPPENR